MSLDWWGRPNTVTVTGVLKRGRQSQKKGQKQRSEKRGDATPLASELEEGGRERRKADSLEKLEKARKEDLLPRSLREECRSLTQALTVGTSPVRLILDF